MIPDVFDRNGQKRDWAWVTATYGPGVRFLASPTSAGGQKFRLMRIDETEGPATLVVRVLAADGTAQQHQPVANHWPDESLPDLRGQGLQTLWRERALYQYTGSDGYTGFGLGTGSYIADLNQGGPHTTWVLSPSLPSDGITGLGMLGGTNHRGLLALTFQIANAADTLHDALLLAGAQAQLIQFNPQAALQKAIFEAGFVPNSGEFDLQFEGTTYRGQRAEHLQTGAVRVYYCRLNDWGNVRFEQR